MTKNINPQDHIRRVHGRRIGRPLNAARKSSLEEHLPTLGIPHARLTEKADLDPATLFSKNFGEYWMEIGFGNGEHLAALLDSHPDKGFIGAEPFINGMAAFLKDIREDRPGNVRVLMDDAMKIIHSLQNESLDRLYILNPDPWPKKRHHKRRIVNAQNLGAFARVLKPGAFLVMATDVEALCEWMIEQTSAHSDFIWDEENRADIKKIPKDWVLMTRYAKKGIAAGRLEEYLIFRKKITGEAHEITERSQK